jgi:hypothetical protein
VVGLVVPRRPVRPRAVRGPVVAGLADLHPPALLRAVRGPVVGLADLRPRALPRAVRGLVVVGLVVLRRPVRPVGRGPAAAAEAPRRADSACRRRPQPAAEAETLRVPVVPAAARISSGIPSKRACARRASTRTDKARREGKQETRENRKLSK